MKWIKSLFLMMLYLAFISQGSLYSQPTLTKKTTSCQSDSHSCCKPQKSEKSCCGSNSCCNTTSSHGSSNSTVSIENQHEIRISKIQKTIQKSHSTFFDFNFLGEYSYSNCVSKKLIFLYSKSDFQSLLCTWIC